MVEYAKEKTNERDIVIQTVMDLRAISQREFRGGYINKIINGNTITEVYVPDSRREYCQLVDFLSDMLIPEFDEETKKLYEPIVIALDKLVDDKNADKISDEDFIVNKLRLSRRLLQYMFLLLKKINWLKKKMVVG